MALYAIGEALIDFVPSRPGKPDADIRYTPAVGGAPLNVAAAYARLGGKSYSLSQVGDDAFGEQIAATAQAAGVDTRYLKRSREAKTALAFVTLHDNGEREFAFYRDPSADMLYAADNLAALISFDINLRLPLWKNPADLHAAVQEYLPLADILKISDDELEFVTGERDPARGIAQLHRGAVKHVIYTRGAQGAAWYDASGQRGAVDAYKVQALDATGAGDAFIGGLLAEMSRLNLDLQQALADEHIAALLRHAAAVGAITTL